MSRNVEFLLLSLASSPSVRDSLNEMCEEIKVHHINVLEGMHVLDTLLDFDINLILFHTETGEDEVYKVVDMIQNDIVYKAIPLVIISNLLNNEEFAYRMSKYPVVSIFTYANWKYQLKNLLELLHVKSEEEKVLHKGLIQSQEASSIDPLTGALNRIGIEKKYEHLVNYYASNKEAFSLIMYDIDFFKNVNDTYGHDVGDEVLVATSSKISKMIRKDDALCHFGGEEFIVFLSNTELEIAKKRAEVFRQEIEKGCYSSKKINITASFGVIEYQADESLEKLIHDADALLYRAKERGRNQVQSA